MNKYIYSLLFYFIFQNILHAQIPQNPLILNSLSMSTGIHIKQNPNAVISKEEVTNDANVLYRAGNKIQLLSGFKVNGLTSIGKFKASITNDFEIVSMHPNGWSIPKYDKFEMGLKLPNSIQSQIDNFFNSNGTNGITPYDEDNLKIIFYFTINGSQYQRNAFYYRDFSVSNNYWQEQTTDYKLRVRFAPPQTGNGTFYFEVWLNGVLQNPSVYGNVGNFTVIPSNNHGHLTTENTNNTRKFFFEDGTPFFGVGQNLWADGDVDPGCIGYPCVSPSTYNKLRNYIVDLANNGGNFTRLRIDNFQFPIMWPNQQYQVGDPPPDADLSKYLLNYDNNQKHMWELDATFDLLEEKEVYAILSLLQDQNYKIHSPYGYPPTTDQWAKNPYSAILGQGFTNCKTFFSNSNAQSIYKKYLDYVIARWGYSTSLGGWMMINETVNVSDEMVSYTVEPNGQLSNIVWESPYTNDLTFRGQVNQWVCDMKFYMEQQYPWHPTTTGLTESVSTGNNRLPCLNFWSQNDYTSYSNSQTGLYYLRDYNRNAIVHGYYNDYKPFIWGELGMPDNTIAIDIYNDRTFHNTNWISVMSGALGTGMYWNDMGQYGGTNHRANFNALKTFVNDVDWSQPWDPHFNVGQYLGTTYNNKTIFTFSAINIDNSAIAFTLNNSSNWANEDSMAYHFPGAKPFAKLAAEQGISIPQLKYDIIANGNTDPPVNISGFVPNISGFPIPYKVDVYKTYGNGGIINTIYPYLIGSSITFWMDLPFNIGPNNYPDYAFIASPYNAFRASDTLALNQGDSVNLTPGFVKNNDNYNTQYNLGNGTIITNTTAIINYTNAGVYTITLTVTDKTSDSVYYQTVKVNSKDDLRQQAKLLLYPNPTVNNVNLMFDEALFIDPEIKMYNQLGKLVFQQQNISSGALNLPNLSSGIYFIQFNSLGCQKNLKLVIQN